MATSGEVNPQQKQPKMDSIIHCSDDREKLVSIQGVDSSVDSNNLLPQELCRSIFTTKKLPNGILEKEKQSACGSAEENTSKREERRRLRNRTYDRGQIMAEN